MTTKQSLAVACLDELNYFLLRRITGKSDINDAEEFIEALDKFVNNLDGALQDGSIDDDIRRAIDEELNAGDYFASLDELRENIDAECVELTGETKPAVVEFYASLWRA